VLGVTRLLCGTATPGDALRYGRPPSGTLKGASDLPPHLLRRSEDKKPVVVWNITRTCNLRCAHCYTSSDSKHYAGELTTEECRGVIDDLAHFSVPAILFSGGEPLLRADALELAAYAAGKGIRSVLSTNGTLITDDIARKIKEAGLAYVGISLDGTREVHDRIRGKQGAFNQAMRGLRRCQEVGLRVGVRFTVHRLNLQEVPKVFDIVEEHSIPRLCIYHLAYAGRGADMKKDDLEPVETRALVDYIFERAADFHRRGVEKDILTVDNHADAVYLWMRVKGQQPERADEVWRLLAWNGGNQSGVAIACIDNTGEAHADQFSWDYSFGNVRQRPFSEIWQDTSEPRMAILKDRKKHLKGRCAACRYLEICNGNLRARAEKHCGDFLAPDPACYLTDEEIGLREGALDAGALGRATEAL
jgi:radical SAM protein with 4Fe4S-binding SPASM domain